MSKIFYPAYVHFEEGKAFGVTFPDFPGCFAAADDFQGLPVAMQEAVEVYFHGEDMDIPAPTSIKDWVDDPSYSGGTWAIVELDMSRVSTAAQRVNITLPENLLYEIDTYVDQNKLTRSGFLADAARVALGRVQAGKGLVPRSNKSSPSPRRAAGKSSPGKVKVKPAKKAANAISKMSRKAYGAKPARKGTSGAIAPKKRKQAR
jgi:predicted RNase H-like HicB family nuclease